VKGEKKFWNFGAKSSLEGGKGTAAKRREGLKALGIKGKGKKNYYGKGYLGDKQKKEKRREKKTLRWNPKNRVKRSGIQGVGPPVKSHWTSEGERSIKKKRNPCRKGS